MSLVRKDVFIEIVEDVTKEFIKRYEATPRKRKVITKCQNGVVEVSKTLINRSNKWLLPVVPSRRFLLDIHRTLLYYFCSSDYKDRLHNTITGEKDEFIREIRFRLHGTSNL